MPICSNLGRMLTTAMLFIVSVMSIDEIPMCNVKLIFKENSVGCNFTVMEEYVLANLLSKFFPFKKDSFQNGTYCELVICESNDENNITGTTTKNVLIITIPVNVADENTNINQINTLRKVRVIMSILACLFEESKSKSYEEENTVLVKIASWLHSLSLGKTGRSVSPLTKNDCSEETMPGDIDFVHQFVKKHRELSADEVLRYFVYSYPTHYLSWSINKEFIKEFLTVLQDAKGEDIAFNSYLQHYYLLLKLIRFFGFPLANFYTYRNPRTIIGENIEGEIHCVAYQEKTANTLVYWADSYKKMSEYSVLKWLQIGECFLNEISPFKGLFDVIYRDVGKTVEEFIIIMKEILENLGDIKCFTFYHQSKFLKEKSIQVGDNVVKAYDVDIKKLKNSLLETPFESTLEITSISALCLHYSPKDTLSTITTLLDLGFYIHSLTIWISDKPTSAFEWSYRTDVIKYTLSDKAERMKEGVNTKGIINSLCIHNYIYFKERYNDVLSFMNNFAVRKIQVFNPFNEDVCDTNLSVKERVSDWMQKGRDQADKGNAAQPTGDDELVMVTVG